MRLQALHLILHHLHLLPQHLQGGHIKDDNQLSCCYFHKHLHEHRACHFGLHIMRCVELRGKVACPAHLLHSLSGWLGIAPLQHSSCCGCRGIGSCSSRGLLAHGRAASAPRPCTFHEQP